MSANQVRAMTIAPWSSSAIRPTRGGAAAAGLRGSWKLALAEALPDRRAVRPLGSPELKFLNEMTSFPRDSEATRRRAECLHPTGESPGSFCVHPNCQCIRPRLTG